MKRKVFRPKKSYTAVVSNIPLLHVCVALLPFSLCLLCSLQLLFSSSRHELSLLLALCNTVPLFLSPPLLSFRAASENEQCCSLAFLEQLFPLAVGDNTLLLRVCVPLLASCGVALCSQQRNVSVFQLVRVRRLVRVDIALRDDAVLLPLSVHVLGV